MAIRKRHGRNRRYWSYRRAHFLPDEARELSALHRLDYHEVRIMYRQRQEVWQRFVAENKGKGYADSTLERKWRARVRFWYVDQDFLKIKEANAIRIGAWKFSDQLDSHNVWFWFDYIRSLLPVEKQYQHGHRGKQYETAAERKSRAQHEQDRLDKEQLNERMLDNLFRRVVDNPSSDKRLTILARNSWGFKGASLLRTAYKRGYAL